MDIDKKLSSILERYSYINKKLSEESPKTSSELVELNKELSELFPLVEKINEYLGIKNEISGIIDIINNDSDQEIKKEAEKEQLSLQQKLTIAENSLLRLLIPKDHTD